MKAHAVSLLVVSFLFHPCVGHATWQPNGTGVAITAGDQRSPFIIPDATGGTIISWVDSRNYDIYAQHLNGGGVAQWASNGVLVCSATGDQFGPQIVPDGHGGAIVMWGDLRSGEEDIFAQRFNSSGLAKWTAGGVELCTAAGNQGTYGISPSLVSDGAGGAIATWTDERNGIGKWDIYAQRVNASGLVQWNYNGALVCAALNDQGNPTIVADGVGGAIITWNDKRNLFATGEDVCAQRLDSLGGALWTANGVPVCTAFLDQFDAEIVSDGSNGAIVAWTDVRSGGGDRDVYAQRLNASSGASLWTLNGVPVCTGPGYQQGPELVPSGLGGAIVAWSDTRFGNLDIFAQRLDPSSGVGQWIANGVALCTDPASQYFPAQQSGIATDGAGGAYVPWTDARNGAGDIYSQHVNFNGVAQWLPNGAAMSTGSGLRDHSTITFIATDASAVVTWEDNRSGDSDVYALPVPNTPIRRFERYVPYPHGIIFLTFYPVGLLFDNVITAGFTYLDITPAGPALPPSFVLGDGRYYNLSTTAGTTDNIQVCIKFDPATLQHPAAALRMLEYNVAGPAGPTWLDITTMPAMGDSICGTTTHLSTFVIGFPSVTEIGYAPAPASFALGANVPNPFNPITTIRYDVPAPGADVSISIYDVSGRLIRSLVKEHRGAGAWSAQWNGENDRGQSVASGVYFYRMRAAEFVETKKMMLLK